MTFPSLDTMVKYGIYTVHQLNKYNEGLLPPKQVTTLSECDACDFVYKAGDCPNCLGLIKSPKADSNEL
jgi:hypothetical protein